MIPPGGFGRFSLTTVAGLGDQIRLEIVVRDAYGRVIANTVSFTLR